MHGGKKNVITGVKSVKKTIVFVKMDAIEDLLIKIIVNHVKGWMRFSLAVMSTNFKKNKL